MSKRLATLLLLVMGSSIASGCSMCCGEYDYHYPTLGGAVPRANPVYGRVGSIYSDPSADPGAPAVTNHEAPDPREQQRRSPDEEPESVFDGGITETGPPFRDGGTDTTRSSSGQWH